MFARGMLARGGSAMNRWMEGLVTDLADLALSRACVVCAAIGSVLCEDCRATLAEVQRHDVRPWVRQAPKAVGEAALPADMPPVIVASLYQGAAKRVIIAHKEHGVLGLTPALGSMLAMSIAALGDGPFTIVAVPPHRDAIRRRGVDTLEAIAHGATRELRGSGWRAQCVPLLRRRADGGRHVGRSAHERRSAVHETMEIDARIMGRGARGIDYRTAIVVVDDVVTTGATVQEAVRTLRQRGLAVVGIAAVAGTRRSSGASVSECA